MLLGSGEMLYTCTEDCWVLVLKGKRELDENTLRCGLWGRKAVALREKCAGGNGSEAWDLEECYQGGILSLGTEATGLCTALCAPMSALCALAPSSRASGKRAGG